MSDITRGYTFTDASADWASNKNTAVRLNKMVDDATVNLVAGTNITIFRNDSGINISAASGGAGSPGYYGVFHDTTDQVAAAANTPYAINLNSTDESNGVSIVSGNRITIANGGTYNLQFSLQLNNTDSQIQDVSIWLRKNGSDVAATNSVISVSNKHGAVDGHMLPAWNFVFTAAAGDYYQLMWSTASTAVTIETIPAGTTPVTPLTPSVILTVTQVVNIAAPGSITAGQIASVNASSVIGQIVSNQIKDSAITTAKFAADLTPVEIVSSLPSSGNFNGRCVFLTTDNKLYRYSSSGWTAAVAAIDVTGSLSSAQISDAAITEIKLATNAVTSTKIADSSISTPKIVAGAITSAKIDALAITSDKIAANAITATKIDAGAITTDKIATNAITSAKIDADAVTAGKISAAAINSREIAAGAITTEKIYAGAVDADKIAANSITAGKIVSGTITGDRIAANTITGDKITATTITATVALESPKIAVAGACYNASSYTSNTFASTTLRWDDDGTTKPSGFGGGSYAYLSIPGVTLYGWGNGSGAFETRYGRTNPKISVFSSAEFSNIASGNYVSYVVQYSTDGGSTWYQVTPIDASTYNPNTFVSSSGAVELSGLSATGDIQFRFRFNGTSGGNPKCEYCQVQVVCYNF